MTMNPARDLLVAGLRNAHGMETQARELMARQCERLGDYPAVQTRVRQHLAETIQQLHRLQQCLAACGETASAIKDTLMSALANLTAFSHAAADDEILKNTFANQAFETSGDERPTGAVAAIARRRTAHGRTRAARHSRSAD